MPRADVTTHRDQGADSAGQTPFDFAAQFRESFRVLWRIAAGIIGNAASAEDVVQEAAIVALGKVEQFEPGTNFTAWMAKTVRYVALNHARKEQKRRNRSTDSEMIESAADPSPPPGPSAGSWNRGAAGDERTVTGVEFDGAVAKALGEVSTVARACLLLRTLDGLEYSTIAALLGIPEGTAMSHVHRTRKFLRRRLARTYGDTWSAEAASHE